MLAQGFTLVSVDRAVTGGGASAKGTDVEMSVSKKEEPSTCLALGELLLNLFHKKISVGPFFL
jgi:hypothetical protein